MHHFRLFTLGEAFDLEAFLASTTLRPDSIWRRGEEYASFGDRYPNSGVEFNLGDGLALPLSEQEGLAIAYLKAHGDQLRALARFPGVTTFTLGLQYRETFESDVTGSCLGPSGPLMRQCLDVGCVPDYYVTLDRMLEPETEGTDTRDADLPFETDTTTMAVIGALLERHRAEGLDDAEAGRRILAELGAALPSEAFGDHELETIVARWQQAIEEATR